MEDAFNALVRGECAIVFDSSRGWIQFATANPSGTPILDWPMEDDERRQSGRNMKDHFVEKGYKVIESADYGSIQPGEIYWQDNLLDIGFDADIESFQAVLQAALKFGLGFQKGDDVDLQMDVVY